MSSPVPQEILDHPDLQALSPQHLIFVLAYVGVSRFKGVHAANVAGFAEDNYGSRKTQASILLARDDIKQAIKALAGPLALSAEVTLAAISDEAVGAEEAKDRLKALDMLARCHRLYEPDNRPKADAVVEVYLGGVASRDDGGDDEIQDPSDPDLKGAG